MTKEVTYKCDLCTKPLTLEQWSDAWYVLKKVHTDEYPTIPHSDDQHICANCFAEMQILLGQDRHRKQKEGTKTCVCGHYKMRHRTTAGGMTWCSTERTATSICVCHHFEESLDA